MPRTDGDALLEKLRAGSTYSEIDAVASGATLEFSARTADEIVGQGSVLRGAGTATFRVRAAQVDGASTVAFRNGVEVSRAVGTSLDFQSAAPGAFRIEIHVAGAPGTPPVPWVVSNPIFRFAPSAPVQQPAGPHRVQPGRCGLAHREQRRVGRRRSSITDGAVEFAYRLRGGPPASQFVALVADLPRGLPSSEAVSFTGQAKCANPTLGSIPVCRGRERPLAEVGVLRRAAATLERGGGAPATRRRSAAASRHPSRDVGPVRRRSDERPSWRFREGHPPRHRPDTVGPPIPGGRFRPESGPHGSPPVPPG